MLGRPGLLLVVGDLPSPAASSDSLRGSSGLLSTEQTLPDPKAENRHPVVPTASCREVTWWVTSQGVTTGRHQGNGTQASACPTPVPRAGRLQGKGIGAHAPGRRPRVVAPEPAAVKAGPSSPPRVPSAPGGLGASSRPLPLQLAAPPTSPGDVGVWGGLPPVVDALERGSVTSGLHCQGCSARGGVAPPCHCCLRCR